MISNSQWLTASKQNVLICLTKTELISLLASNWECMQSTEGKGKDFVGVNREEDEPENSSLY